MSASYSQTEQELLRTIGEILRGHRVKRSLTQEHVVELAGINVTYLSDVEGGKRNISLLNLARLAKAFDIPLENIFMPST